MTNICENCERNPSLATSDFCEACEQEAISAVSDPVTKAIHAKWPNLTPAETDAVARRLVVKA